MKSFVIGLVVLMLLVFGALYLVNTNSPDAPATSTPTSTPPTQNTPPESDNSEVSIPAHFRHHAEPEYRYQIAIPYSVDVSSPQTGITRYRYVGPNNEPNSEITDGYTVTINAQATDKTSLEELIPTNMGAPETESPQRTTIGGIEAWQYVTQSALGNTPITNYAILPDNGYEYHISINLSPTTSATYESTTTEMVHTLTFFDEPTAASLQKRTVPIAMLDYAASGEQYIRESTGKERGCDKVVLIEHILEEPTNMPLTASLEQLFFYEQAIVGGWQNFVASQNETLSFDRAAISDGTAKIYLTGELGPLGGVCDNPRTAIQIEETALAYDTVSTVELHLNNEPTDLIPSGRGR